ncbi:hypothetical protein M0R19_05295 [Candidatus Pacearchaeota archaeon]|jgi:hypothetical protein|nr:hypothetical protein [Candidatus Pacearchaeota archaeon]
MKTNMKESDSQDKICSAFFYENGEIEVQRKGDLTKKQLTKFIDQIKEMFWDINEDKPIVINKFACTYCGLESVTRKVIDDHIEQCIKNTDRKR